MSEKNFHPDGMAVSPWTRPNRAVREIPVAADSAPGFNTTCRGAYHPGITVSPFLRTLSVSYFEQTLWHCGKLGRYVGMSSLGMHVHRDYNAIGHAAKNFPRVPSTSVEIAIPSLQIIHIIPSRQISEAIDNPSLVPSISPLTTCTYLWNHTLVADDVSNTDNFQSHGCRCLSQLYKFGDWIQVTQVFS